MPVRILDTRPNLLALHAAHPLRYPHLLQSTAHGQYDILFAFPGDSLRLQETDEPGGAACRTGTGNDFLENFDRWWVESRVDEPCRKDLPFHGGWFVYLGYELARQVEPVLSLPQPVDGLPTAIATRFPAAVLVDHHACRVILVAEPEKSGLLEEMEADINALSTVGETDYGTLPSRVITEADPDRYLQAVDRILTYIREGDVFQVNLSRLWDIRLGERLDPVRLYHRLCQYNPAPFSGLATWPEGAIISSSPERLVRTQGQTVETRPIAGTRPRSSKQHLDTAYSAQLLTHPKERAEHIMLIDLERNDLGRVCRPGTIEVNELMILESYAHVHHIVSNIRGRLYADITPGQVIRAVFPGGTITGCPKVRCMEIIAELEQEGRGAYTGSMGYINLDGSMDLNILIRTMTCRENRIQLRAGAGIVADSVPERELEETRAKARGLLLALDAGRERTQLV